METTTIASALVTAITTIAGDATNSMVQIVPVAAPIGKKIDYAFRNFLKVLIATPITRRPPMIGAATGTI